MSEYGLTAPLMSLVQFLKRYPAEGVAEMLTTELLAYSDCSGLAMTEPPVAAKIFRVMRGANFAMMALLVLTY